VLPVTPQRPRIRLFLLGLWMQHPLLVALLVAAPCAAALMFADGAARRRPAAAPPYQAAATSITPITNVSAGSSGILFAGDAYDVTCTVGTDTVTLYAAAHDGSIWRVYDSTACTLAVGGGRTCRFPADRLPGLTWNAYKTGAGTVASCTAQQSFGQVVKAPASGSGGSVTSVALTLPAQFSVSGSPVTGSGTLSASWANQSANIVLAGPASGGAAAPAFRALVDADLPTRWQPIFYMVSGGGIFQFQVGQNVGYETITYAPFANTRAKGDYDLELRRAGATEMTWSVLIEYAVDIGTAVLYVRKRDVAGSWSDGTTQALTGGAVASSHTVTQVLAAGEAAGLWMYCGGAICNFNYVRIFEKVT
jgi:hypothetical protein